MPELQIDPVIPKHSRLAAPWRQSIKLPQLVRPAHKD